MAWFKNQLDFMYSNYIPKLKHQGKVNTPFYGAGQISGLLFQSGIIRVIFEISSLWLASISPPKAVSCTLEVSQGGNEQGVDFD